MIDDNTLKELATNKNKYNAEFRRADKAAQHYFHDLLIHARAKRADEFDQAYTDLEQAIGELWQLVALME